MSGLRIIRKILTWAITAIVAAVIIAFLGLFLLSVEAADRLPLVGDYEPMIVQSGSMEPGMRVGGMVMVQKNVDTRDIAVGDVITFRTPVEDGKTSFTTHRVVNIAYEGDALSFETKGDANEDADSWTVPASSVMGREVFALPYLGYFVRYVQSPLGFLAVVVVPALLVIALELRKVFAEVREREAVDACD